MTSTASIVEMLGESSAMVAIREQVAQLLRREADAGRLPPILIEGETGTGKGLLARAIHRGSTRAAAPFVDINCAAIPENLLEAELFGFERGAFTDARHAKPGLLQAAHRGVVFLDEIGLLPDVLQSKVLKVIEERVVRRLGSVHGTPTDIWIIAATSEDLLRATRARRFREDLYHRLAGLTLRLPPVRERGDDLIRLAEHFLARACRDYRLPAKILDGTAREALRRYRWPGNVRELANVMERVALLSEDPSVTARALNLTALGSDDDAAGAPADAPSLREAVGDVERRRLLQTLHEEGWNISRAALRLGIPRSSLRYRLEKHGLQPSTAVPMPPTSPVPPVAAAEMGSIAPGLPPWPVDWRRRHLAFLRVTLAATDREPSGRDESLLRDLLAKVQGFGGRLEEQGVAGFLAVFGIEPVEDAWTRAAHAAVAIRNAVQRARDADPLTPAVRCVLHAAHVLAGSAGADIVIDMQGRHEARAALDALTVGADADAILVSEAAAPLLDRRFQLEAVGRSLPGPPCAYRVVAREASGYGLAGRPLSPFVGRAREMALLDDVRARVQAGHGQVVALVGEPGVGKSRIMYEMARAAREQGWLALEGHAASYGAATPYFPLVDLLRRYFRLGDADPPPSVQARIASRLHALQDPALPAIIAPLLAVLGGPVDEDAWRRLDPPERRERILDALRRLVLRASQGQPLILLIEDLQWVDAETQSFLDRLVESLPAARLLLVVSCRPEYRHAWGGKTYYRQLPVDPLSPEGCTALLDALLGPDAALAPVKQLVTEWTEGNPLFIEESVRSLVETGVLAGARGDYRVTRAVLDLQVPATAEAMLAARIDRLLPEDRRLLQVASVVGKDVPLALLQAIADLPDEALHRGLGRLQAAEFLLETALAPEPAYRFTHAVTHEVAYGGLAQGRRQELHARIAKAIEKLHGGRLGEHIERLAHHAFHGGLGEHAVDYLRQAGRKVAARSAPQEARVWFERALTVLDTLPESPSTLEQGFEIRLELRPAMQQLGEGRRMLQQLREAETLAERLNDDHRLARVCALATNDLCRLGELDEALVAGARALEIAGRLDDVKLRVLTTSFLAQTHYYRGDYEQAVELAIGNLKALPDVWVYERLGNSAPASVYDRASLIKSLAELGRFAEASAYEAEALQIAEATEHALTIAAARWAAVMLSLVKGDWEAARMRTEEASAVARAGSLLFLLPFAVAAAALALAESGQGSAAQDRLVEGQDMVERLAANRPAHLAWVYQFLGRTCFLLGRLDEAHHLADRAAASAGSEVGLAAWAQQLLGEIASHPDRFDAARGETHYRHALTLAEPRGMRPLIAHSHRGLGALYWYTGRRDQARDHLVRAATLYREMGMMSWLARVERSRVEGVRVSGSPLGV